MQNTRIIVAAILALFAASCSPGNDDTSLRGIRDLADGDVPTLKPDLPDSTSIRFSLRIDLNLGDADSLFVVTPDDQIKPETAETSLATVTQWLVAAEDGGIFSPELFVDIDWINDQNEFNDVSRTINSINPQAVHWQYLRGRRLRLYPSDDADSDMAGYEYVSAFTPIVHGPGSLFLIDQYALSNFVGDYGTGRIVNTFSLLPGETTELRVSTYRDERLSSRSTASILDSSSSESTESFLQALSDTTTTDENYQSSTTNARFKAKGSYSAIFSSAEASTDADIENTSNSRRDFHNSVEASVSASASRASASRDVYVDTSVESVVEEGREDVSIRTISNINTGHTLNFISYQMNQEFHSVLHLTGLEVGYDDGVGNVQIVPLYQMDQLIESVVVESEQDGVRRGLLRELAAIVDYKGEPHPDFVASNSASAQSTELTPEDSDQTYSINYDYRMTYTDNGTEISVPGIIVNVHPVVMRTDGVYVEAAVGRGSAWDAYTEKLKAKELRQ